MKIFEELQKLSWLSDLIRWIERLRYGPGWEFSMPRWGGWTGGQVERFLRQYRIPVYDRRVTDVDFIWQIPIKVARWAEHLLLQQGIRLNGPFIDPANTRRALGGGNLK